MAHPRVADDFQAIRARMEELRREREGAAVTEPDRGSIEPARRGSNVNELIAICLRRLRNQIGQT
jgi:hypothetical protein